MANRSNGASFKLNMENPKPVLSTTPPLKLLDSFAAAFRHGGWNYSATCLDDPCKVVTVIDTLPEELERLNIICDDDIVEVNIYALDKEKIAAKEKEMEEMFAKQTLTDEVLPANMTDEVNDIDLDALD